MVRRSKRTAEVLLVRVEPGNGAFFGIYAPATWAAAQISDGDDMEAPLSISHPVVKAALVHYKSRGNVLAFEEACAGGLVEAAELRIVIARAHRAKTPRDRALADEIRKLELELGVAKKGQAVANREKKASQKGYSVSIDEEDPHARSGLTPPRSSTRRNWLSNAAFFGLGPS